MKFGGGGRFGCRTICMTAANGDQWRWRWLGKVTGGRSGWLHMCGSWCPPPERGKVEAKSYEERRAQSGWAWRVGNEVWVDWKGIQTGTGGRKEGPSPDAANTNPPGPRSPSENRRTLSGIGRFDGMRRSVESRIPTVLQPELGCLYSCLG